jgi:hypothetical protein
LRGRPSSFPCWGIRAAMELWVGTAIELFRAEKIATVEDKSKPWLPLLRRKAHSPQTDC